MEATRLGNRMRNRKHGLTGFESLPSHMFGLSLINSLILLGITVAVLTLAAMGGKE